MLLGYLKGQLADGTGPQRIGSQTARANGYRVAGLTGLVEGRAGFGFYGYHPDPRAQPGRNAAN